MKTTVVKGVLSSFELMLAILFKWRVGLCGLDIVWLLRSHGSGHTRRIITPLPHNIAQLLTSPHLNYNHSICCWHHWHFVVFVLVIVAVVVIPSFFVFDYFHPWKCSLPSVFTHVLLCPLGMKGTNPHLLWQSYTRHPSQHKPLHL